MKFIETNLKGVIVVEPQIFYDNRGYFFETYSKNKYLEGKIDCNFIQDNQSMSKYGVIRGLHGQLGESDQAKLVRVTKGKVLDVVVDIRPNSETFGQHISIELSEENQKQLFIPRGFLHGFSVLSDSCIFSYKCDNYYDNKSIYGVIYNDKDLNIDWKIPEKDIIISERDSLNPTFKEIKKLINI